MKRALTSREKGMLLFLAIIVIALGYFKLIFEPVQTETALLKDNTSQEQTLLSSSLVQLEQMHRMQRAIEEIKQDGETKAIPAYDNSGMLMRELYRILATTNEYSLDFSAQTVQDGYIIRRPISMTFYTDSYEQARGVVDALSGSDNLNQISDLSISENRGKNKDQVQTDLLITYFEVAS